MQQKWAVEPGAPREVVWCTRAMSVLFQITAEERSQVWTWKWEGLKGKPDINLQEDVAMTNCEMFWQRVT